MKEREIHDLVAEVYSDNRLTNKLKLELKNLISLYSHQAPRVLVIFIFFILYLWMSVAPKIQTSLPLFLKPINFRKICLYTSHVSTSFERDKTRREDKLMICLVIWYDGGKCNKKNRSVIMASFRYMIWRKKNITKN